MSSCSRPSLWLCPALLCALIALAAPAVHAQACGPTACAGSHHFVGFEAMTNGATVETPGVSDPRLVITSVAWPFLGSCAPGGAHVIQEGSVTPTPSYDAGAGVPNDCLTGSRGFADDAGCVSDYDFTFTGGVSVSCFAIRVLDYGDFFPFGGSTHEVFLTAYDLGNNVVDQDVLTVLGGVHLGGGDACVTQPGEPGNYRLAVAGVGIVKVKLTYDAFPDPNVGYDDISFCEIAATPTQSNTWGGLKHHYR